MNKKIEIIAGRPSSGKTLLATQVCRSFTNKKLKVVYFSIELTFNYLSEIFGMPEEVKVIDNPKNDWDNIKTYIINYSPDLCIIDYLQLLEDFNSSLLERIIRDINEIDMKTNIKILSQVSLTSEEEDRLPAPEDINLSATPPNIADADFTSLGKRTYESRRLALV